MRIETELPIWPTEKYRQNGTHLHYRRTLSSSIPIDDLARLPGNTEVSGLISRKLWIRNIDGGGIVIRTWSTVLRRKSADFPENTSPNLPISPMENSLCRRCRVLGGSCDRRRVKFSSYDAHRNGTANLANREVPAKRRTSDLSENALQFHFDLVSGEIAGKSEVLGATVS